MDNPFNTKPDNTVNLAERFAFSSKFNQLFGDGMNLVEESATYLDGPGRAAAKTLPKSAVVLYGTESMRLTTRLMQLASWLLLQRAAKEGEMTPEQFLEEKKKIKLDTLPASRVNSDWEVLPAEFVELVNRSLTLQNRITTIDTEIYDRTREQQLPEENPVRQQLNLISAAIGAKLN